LQRGAEGRMCRARARGLEAGRPRAPAGERGIVWGNPRTETPHRPWAKELDRYVAVGISDGIGEDFVYEFKSTRMSYGGLRRYVLPVAMAQVNIYAWLFKRRRWVVVIFSCEDLKLFRW